MTVATAPPIVDPISFEILSHRLHQVAKEIGVTLERVGGTVNTTQMHDYMTGLYRANGDILSTGNTTGWHVACASFAVKRIIERFADDEGIEPGDMFLLNDPYVAAIHQSDVYVISPIHSEGHLVAWSATFVHVMDIGAMSPGGNSPGATEICHEGVRIPGIKLIERGKLRRDVFDAICNMTRQPAMVGLDLKCEIAANNVARARMQEVYAQYGYELVDAVEEQMISHTERILRSRLQEIPDGSWTATGTIEAGDTWTLKLALAKKGDQLRFDFTGSDPQAKVGINLPYHATFGACYGSVISVLGYDVPKNHGALAPITVIAPPGTVVNAQYPAPVSLNTTSGGAATKYLTDTVMAQMVATSAKWRCEAMARNLGSRRVRHAGTNQHGRFYVSGLGGLSGSGARATGDGVDAGGSTITSHNVEWVEANFPLLYLFRRFMADGAGAGRFRGGIGEEVTVVLHDAPDGKIKGVAYGVAGARNSGQGLFGGYPGASSRVIRVRGTGVRELLAGGRLPNQLAELGGQAEALPYCDFEFTADDAVYLGSGNGGGYGDPLERAPALVAYDVAQGLLSPGAARSVYGVILREGSANLEATERERERMWQQRLGDDTPDLTPSLTLPRQGGGNVFARPLREHLEIVAGHVQCARCGHRICGADEDWKQWAARRRLPPTAAGPLMAPLEGQFILEQLYCPACGALFSSEMLPTNEVG